MAWDGFVTPFQEFYSLIVNDPNGQWSLLVEYGIGVPQKNKHLGRAILSATMWEEGKEPLTIINDFDLTRHDIVHTDQFIAIGSASFLSLAEANGHVRDKNATIRWEIAFEDPVISSRIYPSLLFYQLNRSQINVFSPRLLSHATGVVYADHKKHAFKNIRLQQSHHYTKNILAKWSYASCISFHEDNEAFFEALRIVKTIGKMQLPMHFFRLKIGDHVFEANGLTKSMTNSSDFDGHVWRFQFTKSHHRFEGQLVLQPAKTVEKSFLVPGMPQQIMQQSTQARLVIKISERHKGSWQFVKELTSDHAFVQIATDNDQTGQNHGKTQKEEKQIAL